MSVGSLLHHVPSRRFIRQSLGKLGPAGRLQCVLVTRATSRPTRRRRNDRQRGYSSPCSLWSGGEPLNGIDSANRYCSISRLRALFSSVSVTVCGAPTVEKSRSRSRTGRHPRELAYLAYPHRHKRQLSKVLPPPGAPPPSHRRRTCCTGLGHLRRSDKRRGCRRPSSRCSSSPVRRCSCLSPWWCFR